MKSKGTKRISVVNEISSAEILHRNFSTSMLGYQKKEVEEFLEKIAAYIEELEKKLLLSVKQKPARQSEESEKEDYSRREELIGKTLLMAEKTKEELLTNAQKEADNIIKEAELHGKKMVTEAKKHVSILEHEILNLEERKRMFLLRFKAEMEALLEKIRDDDLLLNRDDTPEPEEREEGDAVGEKDIQQ